MQVENIACIPAAKFHALGHFNGFERDVEHYRELLTPRTIEYQPRDQVENDPTWKQLIPYIIVYDGRGQSPLYFVYCRGTDQAESRLHKLYSIGIGGHVNDADCADAPPLLADDPFMAGAYRELREELHIESAGTSATDLKIERAGLVNCDDAVGRVHLGVVFLCNIGDCNVRANERSMHHPGWWYQRQLVERKHVFETWSQICIDNLL